MVKMNKKGDFFIWFFALVAIFTISVIYLIMSEPWQQIYDKFEPNLTTEHKATAHKLQSVWKNWPILMILGVIITAVVMMNRKGPDVGYYY